MIKTVGWSRSRDGRVPILRSAGGGQTKPNNDSLRKKANIIPDFDPKHAVKKVEIATFREGVGSFFVPKKYAQPVVAQDAEKPGAGEHFVPLIQIIPIICLSVQKIKISDMYRQAHALKLLKSLCFQLSTKMSVCCDRQAISLQAVLGHMAICTVALNDLGSQECGYLQSGQSGD